MNLGDILFFTIIILNVLLVIVQSPNQKSIEFLNEDFYESFWPTEECFKLNHNYITAPHILVIGIYYGMHSVKTRYLSKTVERKYQVRKINGTCTNYATIKALGEEFSSIVTQIFISLYLKHEYDIALFIYEFNKNFIHSSYKLIDISNNLGLEVFFSDSAKTRSVNYNWVSHELKSYLRTIPKTNGYICVVTPNDHNIVLSPEYLHTDRGLIIGIEILFMKNGEHVLIKQYPAFECDQNKIYPVEPVYLIEDGSDINHSNFLVNIETRLIYLKIDISTINFYTFQLSFSNLFYVNLKNMKYLPRKAKKIFFLLDQDMFARCSNNDVRFMWINTSKYAYNNSNEICIEEFRGVIRKKWISKTNNSSCI